MEQALLKLSPSSATDFKSCPQLFKYRAIDRLQEPISGAAARGSLVHGVLERLFAEAPPLRTPARAAQILEGVWQQIRQDPEFRPDGLDATQEESWLEASRKLL